jgi:hypothetical protein
MLGTAVGSRRIGAPAFRVRESRSQAVAALKSPARPRIKQRREGVDIFSPDCEPLAPLWAASPMAFTGSVGGWATRRALLMRDRNKLALAVGRRGLFGQGEIGARVANNFEREVEALEHPERRQSAWPNGGRRKSPLSNMLFLIGILEMIGAQERTRTSTAFTTGT